MVCDSKPGDKWINKKSGRIATIFHVEWCSVGDSQVYLDRPDGCRNTDIQFESFRRRYEPLPETYDRICKSPHLELTYWS